MDPSSYLERRSALPLLALAAVALSACDNPKPRHVPPPPTPIVGEGVPPAPAWAAPLVGRRKSEAFAGELAPCIGNTDVVTLRYAGSPQGVKIVGWGWDTAAKIPIAQVILVDLEDRIAGVGEGGLPRPGVPAVRPEVTSPDTGWEASVARVKGPLDAFGIVGGGHALCRLGHIEF